MYTVEDRLWTTENGQIVLEGDWRAVALYATPGSQLDSPPKILEFQAKKPAEKKAEAPAEKKAEAPAEDKAVRAPETKAKSRKSK